jgi:predicted Zn-dependent protease
MKNPWISFLRDKGFYDDVRKLLQKYREKYAETHPLTNKRIQTLNRELTKLQAQKEILEREKNQKKLSSIYQKFLEDEKRKERFKDLSYETILEEKLKQLNQDIKRIKEYLEGKKEQQVLPLPPS